MAGVLPFEAGGLSVGGKEVGSYRAVNLGSLNPSQHRTIVSLSIVYTIGQAVISVSSINDLTDFDHDGIPDNLPTHV